MSNKRHNHGIKGSFRGNVPQKLVERDENGKFLRESSHVIGNGVYHPTRGWKKIRAFNQHILLNSLLVKLGLSTIQA
jgi:hypothetical protein